MHFKALLQCCLLAVCSLLFLSAAAQQHVYSCPYEPQPVGGCASDCQKATGNALLQLYAGLRGPDSSVPWHHETPWSLCSAHCQAMPAYCGWGGVLCCHNGNASRPGQGPDKCSNNHVDHEMCWSNTSAGVVRKIDLTAQRLNGSLSQDVMDALKVLTGFGLSSIDFSSNHLTGSIPERLFKLGENLTSINLNFNKLVGTLPPSVKGSNMKHVYLSFNKLSGTIEDMFCTQEIDPLEALILRSNLFTGTVDMRECTRLMLLDLTDNQLSGSLPVGISNGQLISLRATNNRFSGSIGDHIWKLPLLTTVDLGSNELTGSVSKDCGTSNNLVNVYLGNNSLTGTLPESIVGNSQLLVLELQNNTNIYGTFPSSGALVGLRRLDLHNTAISGVIPAEWGQLPYLEYVDISGTRMSCCETQEQADNDKNVLPRFLQLTKHLSQFDLNSPNQMDHASLDMTYVGEVTEANSQPNNILCPTVVRRPQPESEWNVLQLPVSSNAVVSQRWIVSPIYYWLTNCTCTKFFDKSNSRYLYTGISDWCDATYNSQVLVNVTPGPCLNMSIFYCTPFADRSMKPGMQVGVAIAAVLAVLIVVGFLAHMLLAKASKFRRFLELATIRMKGPPRSGRMSLVVTDIEGYSDIFRRAPEVMYQALVQHNSVLRATKYCNGGFVLEQEGDSYTIAFYNPFHAVVFCLQAQQGLLNVDWPPGLEVEQGQDISVHQDSPGSRKGSKLHMRLSPLLNFGPKLKRLNTDTSTRSMGSHVDHAPSALYSTIRSAWGSKMQLPEVPLFNGLRVRMGVVTGEVPSGTALKNSALFQLVKVIGDFGNGGQIILDEATFAAIKDDAQALGAVDASGINYSKLSSGRSGWTKLLKLCGFARPRAPAEEVILLDMGAFCQATGEDADELPYTTSRTLDVKQPEPAAAAAVPFWRRLFQPCSPCCRTPDEDGLSGELSEGSPKGSSAPLPPAAQVSRPYLGSRVSQGRSSSISVGRITATASALTFQRPGAVSSKDTDSVIQEVRYGADVGPQSDMSVVGRSMSFSARATKQWATLRKTFTRSQQSFQATQSTQRDWESVRLFQVLPPALAARAHAWHNKMNVKDGWICWDNIYFEAAGSTHAPLTGGRVDFGSGNSYARLPSVSSQQPAASTTAAQPISPTALVAADATQPVALSSGGGSGTLLQPQPTADSTSSSGMGPSVGSGSRLLSNPLMQPLPPVTMVFMAVEGPEQLVRRRRTFTPLVQSLLSRVVRDALRRLGGYLCRVQDGDMKFMVAFASPVTAMEWCLLVQMSAMYLPWPQSSILLLSSCKEVVDSTGRLVFRGPRLKMGVSEGVPRSIIPDHEGRADYHGASINMSARFMDKGARGGQIACTLELAQQVMAVWAAGGCSSTLLQCIDSLHSPLSVSDSIAEDLNEAGAAAVAEAGVAAAPAGNGTAMGHASSQDSTACSRGCQGSSNALQPFNIELPQGHVASAAECYAAAAVAATAARSSAGGSASPAGAVSNSSSKSHTSKPSQAQMHSPLSILGPRSSQDGSTATAVQPAVQSAGSSSTGRVGRQRSIRRSCPGSLPVTQQQQQQGSAAPHQQQQRGSRLSNLWLPRSRSTQDTLVTSSSGEALRSGHSRAWQGTRGNHGNHSGQHHQQQQGSGLGLDAVLAPAPVAPSPFVMKGVTRVPFGVEVHRLGLFSFKGGPPQQEMVQVVPTHLLGRAAFISYDTSAPTSRKGQCLKRLEGRVGEPVMVQLPVLAQDYHERLAQRVSGTTGLPHRSTTSLDAVTSPRQQLLDGGHTHAATGGQHGSLEVLAEALRSAGRGSKSVTFPVSSPLVSPCSAAAAAAAAAAATGSVTSLQRAAVPGAAAAGADTEAVSGVVQDTGLGSSQASRPDQRHQNHQQQQPDSQQPGKQPAGKQQHGSTSAAAAGESWHVDMPGQALRHDSFGSVGAGEAVLGSDEELGLSADEVAAARSKSEPQLTRPTVSRMGSPAGEGE